MSSRRNPPREPRSASAPPPPDQPDSPEDNEGSHAEVITEARRALLEELYVEDSAVGRAFLATPIGPRVRRHGVRAALARFVADQLAAVDPRVEFGEFNPAADEVVLQLPTTVELRDGVSAPVRGSIALKLGPLVLDLDQRGAAALAAELLARKHPAAREAERRLRAAPPTYEGWTLLAAPDIAHAFARQPPRLADRPELFKRIRLACTHALDRTLFAGLAERNPGFLDYLQCFPAARALRRRVVAWLGPTNSGKTHRAVLALAAARSGLYLGPLRLLALEQRERVVELGTACSLITGEERDETSATHSSRTVEMADFARPIEVCVLDEMQLAFDRDRGWAWVAAYCGVAAETLIVTGPRSAEPVIRRLAELCGDEVDVRPLERQGALNYEGVLDWRRVPPRSAVIGFSRALVLELKAMFESLGLRVAVIYGGLSPEVRRNEARRFREGEADIVCATDAIGLGLNLPLDRVIFYETDKFDGRTNRRLEPGELLQIAGRAGRGPGATGWVAAFSARDGQRLAEALATPQATPMLDRLPAAPTPMHIRAIATHLGFARLGPILEFFRTRLNFSGGTFFPEVQPDVIAAADLVDTYAPGLPVESRYALACTPIDLDDALAANLFAEWLEILAEGGRVEFPRRLDHSGGLESLEETLKLTTVYRWLALKFPAHFTDLGHVERLRRDTTEQTLAILRRNWGQHGLARRECRHCGRALLPSSAYRTCRDCHRAGHS
jgi:ATP-dependent RNA helicase SUPV3L1/SUV3